MNKEKNSQIVVKFYKEVAKNKKGEEIKDPNGNKVYERDDAFALMNMLGAVDTTKFDWDTLKVAVKLQEKVKKCWASDKKELELTVDEAKFLKDYLKDFDKKRNPQTIFQQAMFYLKTRTSIVEQLEG